MIGPTVAVSVDISPLYHSADDNKSRIVDAQFLRLLNILQMRQTDTTTDSP